VPEGRPPSKKKAVTGKVWGSLSGADGGSGFRRIAVGRGGGETISNASSSTCSWTIDVCMDIGRRIFGAFAYEGVHLKSDRKRFAFGEERAGRTW